MAASTDAIEKSPRAGVYAAPAETTPASQSVSVQICKLGTRLAGLELQAQTMAGLNTTAASEYAERLKNVENLKNEAHSLHRELVDDVAALSNCTFSFLLGI